jgi:hypothetical protein
VRLPFLVQSPAIRLTEPAELGSLLQYFTALNEMSSTGFGSHTRFEHSDSLYSIYKHSLLRKRNLVVLMSSSWLDHLTQLS